MKTSTAAVTSVVAGATPAASITTLVVSTKPRCSFGSGASFFIALFDYSDCNVCNTFAGCASAFGTLRQCFFTFPSGPTQTVDRMTPIFFFPYIIFSPYAPYFSMTFLSGSLSNVNGSLYFDLNFWWEASLSGETPITVAPAA